MTAATKLLLTIAVAATASVVAVVGQQPYGNFTKRAVFAQTGEVTPTSALVNARCNFEKTSDVRVTYVPALDRDDSEEGFVDSVADASTDYTTTFQITNLMPDTKYEYRVSCSAQDNGSVVEISARNSFWTAPTPSTKKSVSFVWAADLAGQGWGRNPQLQITSYFSGKPVKSGYVIFEVMRSLKPDFAVFQGDLIYADNRLLPTVPIPAAVGGGTWINDPPLDLIAVTLDEFRLKWKYNHGDEHIQSFLEEVPIYVQWDDHEVLNNWYPTEIVGPPAFPNNTLDSVLAERSLKALQEFNPIPENKPIYRSQQYGANLELFFLDQRSFRGPNDSNEDPSGNNAELGANQLDWLKHALLNSKAIWKIISNDDPLGVLSGGPGDWDTFGTGDARVLGRELELANLLKFIKDNSIQNVVFVTSDVHFAASLYYDPSRATFTDFNGFYEFVIGPISAGAIGPNRALGVQGLDPSFGPGYEYIRDPVTENISAINLPPPFLQSFGHAVVSADGKLTIYIRDITGEPLYRKTFTPAPSTAVTKCNYFSLVNNKNQVVRLDNNGSTISLKNSNFSIRFTPCHRGARSVVFLRDGAQAGVDSDVPFDVPSALLKLSAGSHNIVARVYSGRSGTGALLTTSTISVNAQN